MAQQPDPPEPKAGGESPAPAAQQAPVEAAEGKEETASPAEKPVLEKEPPPPENAAVPAEQKPPDKLERARQRLAQRAHAAAEKRAEAVTSTPPAAPEPSSPPLAEAAGDEAAPPVEEPPAAAAAPAPAPKKEEASSEPAAAPPPPRPEPARKPRSHRIPIAARISKSQLNDFNAISGDHNIINNARNDVRIFVRDRTEDETDEWTIFDGLTPLPDLRMSDRGATAFLSAELRVKTAALKRDRLLLITCGNDSFLRSASAAVAETLGLPAEQRKLLSFMRLDAQGYAPTIRDFLVPRPEPEAESVIVVDMAGEGGRQFLDSLLAIEGGWTYDDIQRSLRTQHLSLICQVDAALFAKLPADGVKRFRFECWKPSYLQYLLRQQFPDDFLRMEAVIEEQRKRGRWAASEAEFHEQVREYINNKQLEPVMEQGGVSISVPEFFPKRNQPVHTAVVYVAAFFPNLSPADFDRIVTMLLGGRTQTITVKTEKKGKDGAVEQVETEREKRLVDIWREEADSILAECDVVTSKETNRTVTFAGAGWRERVRAHMESVLGLYVQSQFQIVLDKELAFDMSNHVAEDARLLMVDMIVSYPDQFGDGWLCGLVASAVQHSTEKDAAHRFRRMAQLLRELWNAQQQSLVENVLRGLIDSGFHEVVFAMLQILRPTAGLNELEYFRQLLERGNETMRQKVAAYLGRELRLPRKGAAIDTLRALEPWLPPIDRDPDRYSRANTLALQLMLEYCIDETTSYDLASYGKWPTDFALLDATTAEKAKDDFAVLARWLLNPGLRSVLETPASAERANRLISALIAEWAFILLGQAPKSTFETALPFSADAALAVLLQQLVAQAEASHQRDLLREMVEYWEGLKDILLSIANDPDEDTARSEVLWKRQVVRKLLGHFRDLQRIRKAAPSPHAATA